MRIAYLSESLIPSRAANSVQVMKMCRAFARLGHEVTLYARPGLDAVEDLYGYYGVERCFEVVLCRRPPLGGLGKLWYARAVRRAVRSGGLPELCYGRDAVSLSACAGLGRPIVLEAHGLPDTAALRWAQARLLRRYRARLVVISQALRTDYRRLFPWLAPERIVVAPDGADLPAAVSTSNFELRTSNSLRAGYVGHLYPGKGMEVIVPLAKRLPEVEFHVIGGTPEDIALWRGRINGAANLRLHGFVAPERTEAFRQSMNVLLMPTQRAVARAGGGAAEARWISPLKLFEYMAARKPIVASDLPVLREVLQDGVNALLVEADDVEAWAAAVNRLAADPALRQRLAEQAFADVTARYTWDRRVETVLAGMGA